MVQSDGQITKKKSDVRPLPPLAEIQRVLWCDGCFSAIRETSQFNRRLKSYFYKWLCLSKITKRIESGVLVEIKEEAVEEKLTYAGYFVLLSNSRMTRAQVLRHYRDKDQVEKAFMNLKVRLNMRRLRMSSQPGLEGKLFVRYLALILAPELEHRIEQANLFKDYKLDEVLKDLITLNVSSTHPLVR